MMKYRKIIVFMLTAAMLSALLTGCFTGQPGDGSKPLTPLEEAAETYTPEQAEKEGCLVKKDGEPVPSAMALLEAFIAEERDELRLASFDTGKPECRVYEVVRQQDGYLLRSPGEEDQTFSFLRKETWVRSVPTGGGIPSVGSVKTNTSWFLCDRSDVSYLDCVMSQSDGQLGLPIPFFTLLTRSNG